MPSSGPVEVLDYDPGWVARFEEHERQLRRVLGPLAVRVEHIGSTSVPGLAAKPVIDVQVSVPAIDDLSSYRPSLESSGFLHRPHPEVEEAREFFRPPGPRVVHLHVVEAGGAVERRHLLHRDYLRSHPPVAAEYGALKKRLAADLREARQAYQAAKSPFLERLEVDAEAWAAASGWRP